MRRVGHVWRRRTLHTLQHLLYLLVGVVALGAALVVMLALRAPSTVFAVAGVLVVIVALVAGALVVRHTTTRWLAHRRTAAWIDRRAGLQGRLVTLAELGEPDDDALLYPLLIAENRARFEQWRPDRLVPTALPLRALAAAAVGLGSLALVLWTAPALLPSVPAVALEGPGRLDAPARGATAAGRRPPARDRSRERMVTDDTQPSRGVQEWVRQQLWGERWDRVRTALAQADAARRAQDTRRPDGEGTGVTPPTERARQQDGRQAGEAGRDGSRAGDAQANAERRNLQDRSAGPWVRGRQGGAGAGPGRDPNLLGPPAEDTHAGTDAFALSIAARVRTRRHGPRPPSGEVPRTAPDARPRLAHRQRSPAGVHRMPIPAGWEPVVHRAFSRAAEPLED